MQPAVQEAPVESSCPLPPSLRSVFLQVVDELLRPLGEPPLLSLPFLQGRLLLLALVDLHPGKRQTQHEGLQGQDVQEDGDVVQSLRTDGQTLCLFFRLQTPPRTKECICGGALIPI